MHVYWYSNLSLWVGGRFRCGTTQGSVLEVASNPSHPRGPLAASSRRPHGNQKSRGAMALGTGAAHQHISASHSTLPSTLPEAGRGWQGIYEEEKKAHMDAPRKDSSIFSAHVHSIANRIKAVLPSNLNSLVYYWCQD